jgi:transposase
VQAAALLDLSWDAVYHLMGRAVARGLKRRQLDSIRHVGMDEKSFGRGHRYISVLTDLDQSRVLEVVPERTQEAAEALWQTLSEEQRRQVEAVAMDMWEAYENAARVQAPQAQIVHDKFHIAKHLNEAVDQVRRREHKQLMREGDQTLKGSKQLWLFNPKNLSEEQQASFEELLERGGFDLIKVTQS